MNILIGLIPALCWGLYPIFLTKMGGNYFQQLFGTSAGIFICASIVQVCFKYQISVNDFMLYFTSGLFWSIGQTGEVWCFKEAGVSKIMPVTTAFQTIGNSLIGGWLFSEWVGISDNLLGLVALIIILLGVFVSDGLVKIERKDIMIYLILLVTTIGFWGYSGFPHYCHTSGLAGFFPQSLGMLVGSSVIYFVGHNKIKGSDPFGIKNIISGIVFGGAASTYLLSLSLNGLVNAFALSQLNVVIATMVATVILKEKPKNQIISTLTGLVILIFGVFLMVSI
ncbi:glucose uptake protein [Secundilactobacillus pentosiphilus]|uniref:Glucose uptake protein n=1 Tax=Secundilactobacillus pentosiphilus TaxID=1714682 RepID=A0A1Z5IPW2_9LACO|nr:GRP family sugar transporter [Secundilactobacillus pentosiphilus]GAX03787.1 glucose uptake protein [Secundilactobacillus pentosiphilus]